MLLVVLDNRRGRTVMTRRRSYPSVTRGTLRGLLTVACLSAALLAAAACSTSSPSNAPSQPAEGTTVTIHTRDGETFVLADQGGLTLYYFAGDEPDGGSIRCDATCSTMWTPRTVSTDQVTKPAQLPERLDTIRRADGSLQLRYGGKPLYRFASDRAPGDRLGQDAPSWTVAHVQLDCECARH